MFLKTSINFVFDTQEEIFFGVGAGEILGLYKHVSKTWKPNAHEIYKKSLSTLIRIKNVFSFPESGVSSYSSHPITSMIIMKSTRIICLYLHGL
jgi:hypothetical protein